MSAHHWQSAQCVALATQACCPTSCWYLNTVLCAGHKVWRELCFGVGQAICRNNPSPHSIATTHQHNLQPEEFQHSYLEECCGDTCSLSSLYLAKPPCTWPERTTAWSWRKPPWYPKEMEYLVHKTFQRQTNDTAGSPPLYHPSHWQVRSNEKKDFANSNNWHFITMKHHGHPMGSPPSLVSQSRVQAIWHPQVP